MTFRNVRCVVLDERKLSESRELRFIYLDGFGSWRCFIFVGQIQVDTSMRLHILEINHLLWCLIVGKEHYREVVEEWRGIGIHNQIVRGPDVALYLDEGENVEEHNGEAEPNGNQCAETTHLTCQFLMFVVKIEPNSVCKEIKALYNII